MGSARPEYAIVLAVGAILLAVGIPSLRRGELVTGVLCVAVAAAVLGWTAFTYLRSRR